MSGFASGVTYSTYFRDAVNATKREIKAAPARLGGLRLVNTTGADAYLQVFDKLAADVTVGTTVPTFCVRMAANETLFMNIEPPIGLGTGLTVAGCTSATGSTDAAISVLAVYE